MTEPTLFDPPPAQAHSATSCAAARAAVPHAQGQRERVLAFLRSRGACGATDAEIQEALGLDGSTQRPRRVELVRAGLVVDTGRVRPTQSGRVAAVFAAKP